MLAVRSWSGPLKQILETTQSAEQAIEADRLYKPLMRWRQWPDVALKALSGIFIPPHQRLMLYAAHLGAPMTVYVCSRGTSKSAAVDVLYASYRAVFYPKRKGVTLSAAGFRGGQLLYDDLEKWVTGAWFDQEPDLTFMRRSIKYEKVVLRQQNYWRVDFTSESHLLTVPTNDPEKIRGIRGNDLYVDEANFTDLELMSKVADSFLNVLGDFKTGGENAQANNVFYTSTIDYGWRDFQKTAMAAYDGLARDVAALKAAKAGDWDTYQSHQRKGLLQHQFVCFDYTDTIIRRTVTTRDGRTVEITWPDASRKFRKDLRGIPFTVRGENGRLQPQGLPTEVITTYPINRVLEDKLLSGETPEAIWLAEQRNVVDTSTGDVYPHAIVDRASCKGVQYVMAHEQCGPEWAKKYPNEDTHFIAPVMWSCSDPCVLGVDYAPGSRDFSAFVVIRAGPLAEGDFNPLTGLGKTDWSNVIWAEQHRLTSHADVAEKVREFKERYNLIYFHEPHENDTWKVCRAIGLDMRGGGSGVRDELIHINKQVLGVGEYRIYDPLDPDERVLAFATDPTSLPMLDAIFPSDQLNDRLVEFTLGQMTQRLLFVAKDLQESERPFDVKLDVGYNGAKILAHQLRALQQKPTKNYRTFFMKGDTNDVSNKKDLWAAFIYAAKQLRAHVIRQRMIEDIPPPMGAVVTRIGGTGANARARFRLLHV
jgi:hypothetical protein